MTSALRMTLILLFSSLMLASPAAAGRQPRKALKRFRRADALAAQILWVSLCLGALTALLGTLGARHLTGRLQRLSVSVANAGQNQAAGFEVPQGVDEVAQLGTAFAKILGDET